MGSKQNQEFMDMIDQGKEIISKFIDNFFVVQIMAEEEKKQNEGGSVSSDSSTQKEKYNENLESNQMMS
jgi:hypothetical protein